MNNLLPHLYDSHTHLNSDDLFADRKNYLQKFIDVGGKWLVNIWVDETYNARAIEIAREAEGTWMNCRVKATAGYHPSEVCFGTITEENIENKIARLRAQFTDHASELVAVGECGIDVHYEGESYIELQKKLFRAQCEIAKELHLPIVIHSRDDFISTFDVLRDFKDEKIYFHCYGYGAEEIKLLKEYFLNLRIWFCGNVTYPKAQQLRDAMMTCDIHHLVFETDAPRLSPQKVRSEKNEPAHVLYIYEYCAALLSMPIEALYTQIETNVLNLYNINNK